MDRITQEIATTITGNLPKAVLCVRDITKSDALDLRKAEKDAAELQKKFLDSVKKRLQNPFGAEMDSFRTLGADKGFVPVEVQYNPSSLKLESVGGPIESDLNMGMQSVQNIYEMSVPPTATLSMQLVFDAVNNYDAFGMDAAALNAGAALSAGYALNQTHSVRKPCDGLLACMMSLPTRQVIFYWTNMVFRGTLLSVDVNYQMFNRKGNPIRATVELSIQQGIRNKDEDKTFEPYWDEAFSRAFGEAGSAGDVAGAASSFSKATNNAVLNLNI